MKTAIYALAAIIFAFMGGRASAQSAAPIAPDFDGYLTKNGTATMFVLGHASNPAGGKLVVSGVGQPTHGTVEIGNVGDWEQLDWWEVFWAAGGLGSISVVVVPDPNGGPVADGVRYWPDSSFKGGDAFTYTVKNAAGVETTGIIYILPSNTTDRSLITGGVVFEGLSYRGVWKSFGIPSTNANNELAFVGRLTAPDGHRPDGIWVGSPPRLVDGADSSAGEKVFHDPALNSQGDVAYTVTSRDPRTHAHVDTLYAGHAAGMRYVASTGDSVPATTGKFKSFLSYALADTGCVILLGTVSERGGSVRKGLWREDADRHLQLLLYQGRQLAASDAPFAVQSFQALANPGDSPDQRRSFNAAGDVVAKVNFGAGSGALVVFKFDGSTKIVAMTGDSVPGWSNSRFADFGIPSINSNGDVAFRGDFTSSDDFEPSKRTGLFSGSERGSLHPFVFSGDLALDYRRFSSFGDVLSNDSGSVAFLGVLGNDGYAFRTALWTSDSGGGLHRVAQFGESLPGLDQEFAEISLKRFQSVALSPSGSVAFVAEFTADYLTRPGTEFPYRPARRVRQTNVGLWAQDSSGTLQLLAYTGGSSILHRIDALRAGRGSGAQGHTLSGAGSFVYRVTYTNRDGGQQAIEQKSLE